MTTATNEQHPRPTWQDFPSLHDLDFSPGSDAQATLCDLRILRQEATPQALADLHMALTVLAQCGDNIVGLYRRKTSWVTDRHKGCRSCTCPTRSVGPCGAPDCGNWIASVHEQPPVYCSSRCRTRVIAQRRRDCVVV